MKKSSMLLALTLVLGVFASLMQSSAAVATTAGPDCTDPTSSDLCVASVTHEDIDNGTSTDASGATCRTKTIRYLAENFLHVDLWAYFQKVKWCYKGGNITSGQRINRWGEVYFPGWEYKGHTGSAISGGKGKNYYRAWTQGKFQLCLTSCILTRLPWVEQTGWATGSYVPVWSD